MKTKKILARVLQVGGIFMGSVLTIIASSIHNPSEGFAPAILGLLGLAIGSSVWLKRERTNREQINLIKYIVNNHGRATLSELVIALDFPVEKVKKLVDKLQKHGAITVEVSQRGEIIYCCSDIITIESEYDSTSY
ncbi:MAG: hypothetical protein AAGI07_03415 [Bacteroidota bacterium]